MDDDRDATNKPKRNIANQANKEAFPWDMCVIWLEGGKVIVLRYRRRIDTGDGQRLYILMGNIAWRP